MGGEKATFSINFLEMNDHDPLFSTANIFKVIFYISAYGQRVPTLSYFAGRLHLRKE